MNVQFYNEENKIRIIESNINKLVSKNIENNFDKINICLVNNIIYSESDLDVYIKKEMFYDLLGRLLYKMRNLYVYTSEYKYVKLINDILSQLHINDVVIKDEYVICKEIKINRIRFLFTIAYNNRIKYMLTKSNHFIVFTKIDDIINIINNNDEISVIAIVYTLDEYQKLEDNYFEMMTLKL